MRLAYSSVWESGERLAKRPEFDDFAGGSAVAETATRHDPATKRAAHRLARPLTTVEYQTRGAPNQASLEGKVR